MAYLLRCEQCGGELTVTIGQAGEIVNCPCGATVDVPTLRQMRQLSVDAPDQARNARRTWTRAQGVLFSSGLFIAVVAGLLTAYTAYWWAQIDVTPLDVKDLKFLFDMKNLTPTQSWQAWTKEFRDYELVRVVAPHEINQTVANRLLIGSVVGGVFTFAGVATMIAAIAWPGPQSPRR